jgi:histidine triad (HIT) family protein
VTDALDAIRPESLSARLERLYREQAAEHADCPFCEINTGRAPATFVHEWSNAIAIVPLSPVVDGHTLVIPKTHVVDFADDPDVTGATAHRAAQLCRDVGLVHANLITSRGVHATQSVRHLHLHLVPRAENDGLALPWYSGKSKRKDHHA